MRLGDHFAMGCMVAVGACVYGCGTAQTHAQIFAPWPTYQARPDHNAVIRRPGFTVHWQYDAGAKINSGLAVVGDSVIFDTFGKKVLALNVRTGHVVWQADTDNVIMSTPVVGGGLVYVGTGENGSLFGPHQGFAYDTVVSHGVRDIWGRREGDHIIAYTTSSGQKRWSYRTMGEDMPSPVIVRGLVIFANGDDHAYALRADTGQPIWRLDLNGVSTMASATMAQNSVLLSVCDFGSGTAKTVALVPSTGAIRWSTPFGNCDSSPTFGGTRVFLSGVGGNRTPYGFGATTTVVALDVRSGQLVWRYRTPFAAPFFSVGSSERAIAGTYSNGTYYQALPSDDQLLAFDARSGRISWRFHSAGPIKMSPIVNEGRLYVGDLAGLFYTIDVRNGKLLNTRIFDRSFSVSPPVLLGRTIIVAGDSVVHAFPI